MFESLSEKLSGILDGLTRLGALRRLNGGAEIGVDACSPCGDGGAPGS